MREALTELRTNVERAHRNYDGVSQHNTAMWPCIGPELRWLRIWIRPPDDFQVISGKRDQSLGYAVGI